MPKRVAVMDLGTNTFHLLIAEKEGNGFKTLCHLEDSARLGEDGMPDGSIKPKAFGRGVNALVKFKQSLDEFAPEKVLAIGTSALRSAKNGAQFIETVRQQTGIEITSVDGETEAAYIFQGVNSTAILKDDTSLILDIGGGSIEFIIANRHQIFLKRSYEIGAARLMKRFHLSDPISAEEIANLEQYLDDTLVELFEMVRQYPIKTIIGSSGAFETFAELIELQKGNAFNLRSIKTYAFNAAELQEQFDYLINSTHDDRAANPHIIAVRVDMIVVASVVTRYLIHKLNVDEIAMSVYSLKEGVLAQLLG